MMLATLGKSTVRSSRSRSIRGMTLAFFLAGSEDSSALAVLISAEASGPTEGDMGDCCSTLGVEGGNGRLKVITGVAGAECSLVKGKLPPGDSGRLGSECAVMVARGGFAAPPYLLTRQLSWPCRDYAAVQLSDAWADPEHSSFPVRARPMLSFLLQLRVRVLVRDLMDSLLLFSSFLDQDGAVGSFAEETFSCSAWTLFSLLTKRKFSAAGTTSGASTISISPARATWGLIGKWH